MTLDEIRTKVLESNDPDKYERLEVKLDFKHLNFSLHLKGIVAVYEFIFQQVNGWSKLQENLPDELVESKKMFEESKNKIIKYLSDRYASSNEWNDVKKDLESQYRKYFTYEAPELNFLIKIYNDLPESFVGAYRFIVDNVQNISNRNELIGSIMAYEFSLKESSKILERRNAEKASIGKIRNDFLKYLTESETQVSEYIKNTKEKYDDYAGKIDELAQKKSANYDGWFNKIYEDFGNFDKASKDKVIELEDLYKQKLKLEAPAKYWNDRARALRKEGYWWLSGLIASTVVTVVILTWVLSKIADGTIERIFDNTGIAIKWTVVLITLVSFLTYVIRTFSKLTFSSFHLVRDAEEREQLTYVYLALQKEKGIDETERHLIMQSLFSRADSGLLKDDSSPTMPGNIIDKIAQR